MKDTSNREIVIERLIHHPQELVFSAFADPDHLKNWWGPKGYTNTLEAFDLRPGGVWRFIMHAPDGTQYPTRIVFKEVIAPRYISYKIMASDVENDPNAFEATLTFEARGKDTFVTICNIFATEEIRNEVLKRVAAIDGGNQTLERLEMECAKMQ